VSITRRLFNFTREVLRQGRDADLPFVSDYGFPAAIANLFLHRPLAMKIVADFAWEFASRRGWTDLPVTAFQSARQPLRVRVLQALQRWYVNRADVVIVPSQHVWKLVYGWSRAGQKLRVVYNALPHNLRDTPPRREARQLLGWPLNKSIMVTVGRLAEVKRIDVQLQALARMQYGHLVVIGDGPDKAQLEQMARDLGIEDRVLFTGAWPHEQVLLAIRAADIFVLSSRTEGLSHVLLEAMALGTPRVASDVGGNPELILHGVDGLLVPYNDPLMLASVLEDLLVDASQREALAASALSQVERFSWENLVNQTEALLKEIVHAP